MDYRLLIRFNHAPEGLMDLFTSLLGSKNAIAGRTSYGLVEIQSKTKGAYVALLARLQSNKIEYREIKGNYSKKYST